jgi:MFS family permease
VYLGLAFGPFAGGLLTEFFGWRSIFYVATVLGVLISIIGFLFLDKDIQSHKALTKINLKGSFFYMTGLVMLVYGSSKIPAIYGWLMLGSGIMALVFFWLIESRSHMPVLETKLYTQNRMFAFSNLAALINYSATFAIIFLLSLYLQKVKGMSPYEAGTIVIAQPVMMAVFSPVTGRLSDFIQPRYLSTLGLISFSFLGAATPVWIIVLILLWVGLGFAFFSSPNMNTIMSSVEQSNYGIASGSASTMRVIGQIISMTIATLFFAGMFGGQAIETVPDAVFLKAVKWGFISLSFLSIFGIYFSYNRGKIKRES